MIDLNTELQKLNACIHCGMCLPTCPTYRITGSEAESPRGRLYLIRKFLEGNLESPKQLANHLDPCLGCQACVTACPSGVDYRTLLTASREHLVSHQNPFKRGIRRFLLNHVLPNRIILNSLTRLVYIFQKTGLQTVLSPMKSWGTLGKLLQFTPQVTAGQPVEIGARYGENRKGRVALLTGCIMNALYSRAHRASIYVLVANGYEVVIPEQTCCGALAHHSGEIDIAQSLAAQNIESVLSVEPDWIVVNAAGCGSTLKEYQQILSQHSKSRIFSDKVVDILELLAKHPLEGEYQAPEMTVTYHAACHLHHAQGIQQEPYAVLSQIPNLKLVPLVEADMCCGSAGVYNLAHPDLSWAILQDKMKHLTQTRADVVLASNPGCMLQLETGIQQTGIDMKVMHPLELLALAYHKANPAEDFSVLEKTLSSGF